MSQTPNVQTPMVNIRQVADLAGLTGTLTESQQTVIADAIATATAEIERYLGVPLTERVTEREIGSDTTVSQVLDRLYPWRTYTTEALPNGNVKVVVTHGYNADADPTMAPLVRKLLRHMASNDDEVLALWRRHVGTTDAPKRRKSVTTEGQSTTYEFLRADGTVDTGTAAKGEARVGPSLSSLDYWRVAGERISRSEGYGSDPLPRWGMTGWQQPL